MTAHRTAKITLFRHATTAWSTEGRFAGSTDLELTSGGESNVEQYRREHGVPHYDQVLVSPLRRAVRTAEILGYPDAIRDDSLRERDYGQFEGLTTAEIRDRVPGWNVWTDDVPQGEPITEFVARVRSVVSRLRQCQQGTTLIVAHAHWIRMFTALWLELDPPLARLFRAGTLGQTELGWERENPVMLAWNR